MRCLVGLLALAATVLGAPAAARVERTAEAAAATREALGPKAELPSLTTSAPSLGPLSAAPPKSTRRFVSPAHAAAERAAIGAFGPFRVLDETTAALVDTTDARSPAAFRAMVAAHPGIASLTFVECPGTYDDRANLALGRMIRAAGLTAIVPAGGSVRSGAVELVVAGARIRIDDGAEFAVHAWEDQDGYEARDYAPDSLENRKYLTYYREMGMSEEAAAAFYAMTNSAPFDAPLWLEGEGMRTWIAATEPPVKPEAVAGPSAEPAEAPRLAYLDLGLSLY